MNRLGIARLRMTAIVVLALAALLTPGFLSEPSLLALLTTVSFIGCIASGMTLITVSGNIMSFCLGATCAAAAVVFVGALNWGGLFAGLAAALAFGALLTAAQGFIIGWVRASPIIVSIATLSLIYGVAQPVTESGSFYAAAPAAYQALKGKIGPLPIEFVIYLGVMALGQFLLAGTVFGRHLLMLGNSFRAAEAVGVRPWRSLAGAYLWAGLFAAVSGIMLAIRYDAANMSYGVGYDYDAIAAVLVGGTSIKGGAGSCLRSLAGALIIATVQVLLLLQGFRQEWQYLITGVIVLAVIMLQSEGTRR